MWLIGMMGSGKTTVGRAVARGLDVPFYDTDAMVTLRAGQSIPEIWDRVGEEGFRALEREAVAEVPLRANVAAAGGGAVLDPQNRAVFQRSDVVVWLRCPPEELARRVDSVASRPLVGNDIDVIERLRGILEERLPLYRELATHRVETSARDIGEVVEEVTALWTG